METIYVKRRTMLTIDYKQLTVFEAVYLLSNYDGYMDGDNKCLRINKK